MNNQLSADIILNFLEESVKDKKIVAPAAYLEMAGKLIALLGEEHDKLFELQQNVAKEKCALIEEAKMSVAQAKTKVESLDIYREMSKQKAKIERIEETVKIAKIMSKMKMEEMRGY